MSIYKINVSKDMYLNKLQLYQYIYKLFEKKFNLEYNVIYLIIQSLELKKRYKVTIEYFKSSKLLHIDNDYVNPYLKYQYYKTFIIRDKNFNILFEYETIF